MVLFVINVYTVQLGIYTFQLMVVVVVVIVKRNHVEQRHLIGSDKVTRADL